MIFLEVKIENTGRGNSMLNYSYKSTDFLFLTKVEDIVRVELNINGELQNHEDLTTYGLDSMITVKLIVEFEEAFDITFEDEDLLVNNFVTISKITSLIKKRSL